MSDAKERKTFRKGIIIAQQSPHQLRQPSESYFGKHKRLILVLFSVIMAVIILIIVLVPFLPIRYTVTRTRTVNLQYSSEEYGIKFGLWIPESVNVTNRDSVDGNFSITMDWWQNNPLGQRTLYQTLENSSFIQAGTTHAFNLPNDWIRMEGFLPIDGIQVPMYSFNYSISVPTKQENYNVTNMEYKSIIDFFRGP